MEVKLGTHVYLSVSMTTIDKKLPQALFSCNHFSNLHTIQCMEVKLGTHVYFSVSMTIMNKKWPRALFPITTSSLLKLANHAMHGGETWYTCVFQCFHDNQMASSIFLYNYFFTFQHFHTPYIQHHPLTLKTYTECI